MPISRYREHKVTPEVAASLAEINEYSLRAKAMLTALGDYWTNYYRNLDPIAEAATGSVAAFSKEYTHLLDMVKSSNILDIPIQQSDQFDLIVIDYNDLQPVYNEDNTINYYFLPYKDLIDTEYLTTSLFESRVVLVRGTHFDVEIGKGYKFYVDLFGDTGITNFAYEVGEDSTRHMLLWACDIALSSTVIYERYGRFLYKKSIDSEKYKWVVSALMRFYENAKSVKCVQDVLNIMYGIPYTRYPNEVIKSIFYVDSNLQPITSQTAEEPYICIQTDRAEYYTFAFSDVKYKVGDVVPQFSILADFHKVEDYISNPGWWENCAFPTTLAEASEELTPQEKNELMDKVLKYNTVHLNLGVSIDSYETYLANVKQIFSIIESGFPVYLFPLVDTFVRARFIDKEDMDDEFKFIRAMFELVSKYDWGQFLTFNGEATYYMDPNIDHGRKATDRPLYFDGETSYGAVERHESNVDNVNTYDGKVAYNTGWKYSHNNDREYITIKRIGGRWTDTYVRSKSERTVYLTYGTKSTHNGSHVFGEEYKVYDDEFLDIILQQERLLDIFGEYNELLHERYSFSHKTYLNTARFDGSHVYNEEALVNEHFMAVNLNVDVKRNFIDNAPLPKDSQEKVDICLAPRDGFPEPEENFDPHFKFGMFENFAKQGEISKSKITFAIEDNMDTDAYNTYLFNGELQYSAIMHTYQVNESLDIRLITR